MLIVIGIIGILATAVFIIISPARSSARDARRKIEINQIGQLLTLGCFVPSGGDGDYDLQTILDELKAKYPRYASQATPRDPAKGTATESFYRYIVDSTTKKCSVYANLENANEKVTIPGMNSPAAGGGAGVWQATTPGWNGTDKYFQFSN